MKKRIKKDTAKKMYDSVPDDVKIAFGKFYFFSILYIMFFGILYPFVLMKSFSDFGCGIIVGFLSIFYLYIIRDTKIKIKSFISSFYYIFMFLVFLSISFSIIKYFI